MNSYIKGSCLATKELKKLVELVSKSNSTVLLRGETGCGKSTFLDLFMGLLIPTEGEILIDGQVMSHLNKRSWQRHISNVPQHIYLSDGTVAANIAFGKNIQNINLDRVEKVSKIELSSDELIKSKILEINSSVRTNFVCFSFFFNSNYLNHD